MISFLATAMAADPLTASADIVDRINAEFDAPVVTASARARLRPDAILAEVTRIATLLETGGCTTTTDVQQHAAGRYRANVSASGSTSEGLGDFTFGPGRAFSATQEGLAAVGTSFSSYNDRGRITADRLDGGFVVGRWIRIRGSRGVFLTVQGTCDTGGSAIDAVESLQGDLSGWETRGEVGLFSFSGAPLTGLNAAVTHGNTTYDPSNGSFEVGTHFWSNTYLRFTADGYRPHNFYIRNDDDPGFRGFFDVVDDATLGGLSAALGLPLRPTAGIVQVEVLGIDESGSLGPMGGATVSLDQPADVALSRVGFGAGFVPSNITTDDQFASIVFVNTAPGPLAPTVVAPGLTCFPFAGADLRELGAESIAGEFTGIQYFCE